MNKAGEDEEAIPDSHGVNRRQKSMVMLPLDVGQSFEEDEEDENDNDENEGTSLESSTEDAK